MGWSLDRKAAERDRDVVLFTAVAGVEEASMFWWIVDLFLDRDWGDLFGLIVMIAALIVLAVLLATN